MADSRGDTPGPLLVSRDGHLLTLTLHRPHRLNAVSLPLYGRLAAELERAEADRDIRCVILTGSGRAFCADADLKLARRHLGRNAARRDSPRWADVAEVEVNPLFVYEDRAVPVDARAVLDAQLQPNRP